MVRTMKRIVPVGVTILALCTAAALGAEADPGQGARVFRACAACHSLEANRNMTGPSLAAFGTAGLAGSQALAVIRTQ